MSTRSITRKILTQLLMKDGLIQDGDPILNIRIHKNGTIEVDFMSYTNTGWAFTTQKITKISHDFTNNVKEESERVYRKERKIRGDSSRIRIDR